MKLTLLIALVSASFASFAQPEDFTKVKEMMLSGIDSRIAGLQTSRACVAAATKPDEMKKCKDSMKEAHDKNRAERKSKREAWKAMKKSK